eukprot:c3569_g1_i1 orf=188-631(+)
MMACREIDILWKENCRDPLRDWDNGNSRISADDFRRRQPGMDALWVKEDLREKAMDACWVKEGWREKANDEKEVHLHLRNSTALFDSIKACAAQKDLHTGSLIHAHILERGLLTQNISLGNALLSMYAKCGALAKAQQVIEELPFRD